MNIDVGRVLWLSLLGTMIVVFMTGCGTAPVRYKLGDCFMNYEIKKLTGLAGWLQNGEELFHIKTIKRGTEKVKCP